MADNSVRKALLEKVTGIRIKGKPGIQAQLPYTANTPSDLVNLITTIDNLQGTVGNLDDLQDFRMLSSDAEARYRIFDEMETDSVISSALDMYADDATQYNIEGKIIWAESEDSDVAAYANRLIDVFQLNARAWEHIRSLVKYGDLYLELFRDDETGDDADPYNTEESDMFASLKIYKPKVGSEIEEYIEKVENPAVIYELSRHGKIVGFVKVKENDTNSLDPHYNYQTVQISNDDTLLPSDKYVHIYLPKNDRFSESIDMEVVGNDGNTKIIKYKVNRGKSILNDLFKAYKELKLMEDALLLNRVTRSSIIRILQIEMGDMPKSQAREVLKRFKQIIEQKNYMDKTEGTFKSQANPGPIDNCIYVPTYNGKGAITSSNLGGDVDVKSIVDLDYFRQKLAGGLKIPLSYISGTAQENGLGGGSSLTKIDARYARTVKRIQNAYIQGITNLINIFAVNDKLDTHINNFTIKMVSPSTMEDADRSEEMSTKIGLANDIMDILNNLEEMSVEAKRDIIIYLVSNFIKEPEISDIIKEDAEKQEEELNAEQNEGSGGGSVFDNISSPSGGGFSGDFDSGFGSDLGGTSDFGASELEGGLGGAEDFGSSDFGDFEDSYDEEF